MYFNHTLADKGLISKDEYRKVKLKIDRKYHEHSQQNITVEIADTKRIH